MKRKLINKEMSPEQVAEYAHELQFNSPSGSLCESIGETMNEACHQVRSYDRVSHVIGRLNRRKGQSVELDTLINTVIMQIEGKL